MSNQIALILGKLPDSPGIYLFYNSQKELIYVGKATSLKQRVRSYFRGQRTPRPIEEMIHEVVAIDYEITDSVLEAIILESIWIKKNQPKYNVLGKDDKSWNYLVLTKEIFPRLRAVRQHDISQLGPVEIKNAYRAMFGPYPGLNTKAALKLLRRLFHVSECRPSRGRRASEPERGTGRSTREGVAQEPERPAERAGIVLAIVVPVASHRGRPGGGAKVEGDVGAAGCCLLTQVPVAVPEDADAIGAVAVPVAHHG